MKKWLKPFYVGVAAPVVAIGLTVLDWFDVLAAVHHLDAAAMAAVWGNVIVIEVAVAAYSMIDKRQLEIDERRLEKEEEERRLIENQRHTALELIRLTCRAVQESMSETYTRAFIEEYVVPKINSNLAVDPLFNLAITAMFEYDAQILASAQAGALESEVLISYEEMKHAAKTALVNRITFFDLEAVWEEADRKYEVAMRRLLDCLKEREIIRIGD